MKKTLFLLTFILSFNSLFSQEMRYVLKEISSGEYEKVFDTIWQVKKVYTKLGEGNQLIYDTVWVRMNKSKISVRDLSGGASNDISISLFDKGKAFVGLVAQSSFASGFGLEGVRFGYFVAENRLLGGSGQLRFGENTGVNLSAFYRPYFGKNETGRGWVEINTSIAAAEGASAAGIGFGAGYTSMLSKIAGLDIGLNFQKFGKLKGELVLNLGFVMVLGR
jgi:hypothetical protein